MEVASQVWKLYQWGWFFTKKKQ